MNPIRLLDESRFASEYAHVAEPVLAACREEFWHAPAQGVALRCELYRAQPSLACMIVSHGFTESAEKFRELAYYFLQQGYSVLLYDQRGHGYSTRENRDPDTVYIRHFDDYVRDLASLADALKSRLGADALYLFGHSMGGGIAARALELYPDLFQKCVLNAPMIAIRTAGLPVWVCKLIAGTFILLGRGKRRFFGHKPYAPGERFEASCTTSRARFDFYAELRQRVPQYSTNAASYRWIWEALRAYDRLMHPAALASIRAPILAFRAGQDFSVNPDAIARFAAAVPSARLVDIPNVRHEIYRSPNPDLAPYLERLLTFYAEER